MFNQDVHLARVALAAARFCAERGRWPATLDEIVPTYLDRSFLSPTIGWTVLLMPPAESGPDWPGGKPIFCHFDKTNRFNGEKKIHWLLVGVPGQMVKGNESLPTNTASSPTTQPTVP